MVSYVGYEVTSQFMVGIEVVKYVIILIQRKY